jgi:hypothetical protein
LERSQYTSDLSDSEPQGKRKRQSARQKDDSLTDSDEDSTDDGQPKKKATIGLELPKLTDSNHTRLFNQPGTSSRPSPAARKLYYLPDTPRSQPDDNQFSSHTPETSLFTVANNIDEQSSENSGCMDSGTNNFGSTILQLKMSIIALILNTT